MTRVLSIPPGIELNDADGRPVAREAVDGRRIKRTHAEDGRVRVLVDQGADAVGLWIVFNTEGDYTSSVSRGFNGD